MEGTGREAPEKVLNDWASIMAAAHRLLGCSSHRPIQQPHVQEEHSSTNPVNNGESVTEIQSANEKNQTLSEQENPTQTMVLEQGSGNAGHQINFDFYSFSQMNGNCSGTALFSTKGTIFTSSSCKGYTKGIFMGKSKVGKAETTVKIGGPKEIRTDAAKASSMEVGSSRRARADGIGSCGMKYSRRRFSSKKVKTRSLSSIYDDIRSRLPS